MQIKTFVVCKVCVTTVVHINTHKYTQNVKEIFRKLHTFCNEVVHRNCTISPLVCVQRLVAFGKTKLFISTPCTLFMLERERKRQLPKVVSKDTLHPFLNPSP